MEEKHSYKPIKEVLVDHRFYLISPIEEKKIVLWWEQVEEPENWFMKARKVLHASCERTKEGRRLLEILEAFVFIEKLEDISFDMFSLVGDSENLPIKK